MDARLSTTPLISADHLQRRVADMAVEIRRDHDGPLHVVGVLKGAFMFMADLVRRLGGAVSLDFITLSSYASATTSSGDVHVLKDLDMAIEGRDVLIVEDIVDTGVTLAHLQRRLRARGPRTLRTACLLSKPARREVEVPVEYVGFTIEDRFVVGYGLDVGEQYRHLPAVFTIDSQGSGS